MNGNISAPPTVLTVTSQGNVIVNANIDVGTVTIHAAGSFVQSYVAGIDSIGGDPSTLWSNVTTLTEANAAAANPNPPLGSPLSINGNASGTPVAQAVATALATPGTGNIIVANDVFVSAEYLNVDGTIQSGEPDQQVTIDDTYQPLYNPDIPGKTFYESMTEAISGAAAAYQDYENGGLQNAQNFVLSYGLFTNDYKEFLLPEAMVDNIDVYYEAPTGQLVLGQTDVQGGLVQLYGDMLSTGTGNINVLDGYGAIHVLNNTSYPLVTSGLSTGQGTAGMLKITDTGQENDQRQPLVTVYYRQNGQVDTYSFYAFPDGSLASLVSAGQYSGPNAGARTASYQPAAARFVWEDGQSLSVTVTNIYETSSWLGVVNLPPSDLVSSITTPHSPVSLLPGEWIDNAANDPSFQDLTPGTRVDSADYEYSFQQISNYEPFGASDLQANGYELSLPGNSFKTGLPVIFHVDPNGSVGGLTDGTEYYVIVDTSNPALISLASSLANATAPIPVPIPLGSISGTQNLITYSTETETSEHNTTWYGVTTYSTTIIVTTPESNINTNSIRADRPINITFTGYGEGATGQVVTVSTEGDLLIDGPIQNAAGTTTLSAPDGSIQEENSGGSVGGQDITLTAGTGIGGTAPLLLDLTNSGNASNPVPGTLNATSANGSINIDDQSGSIKIGQVIASQTTGNVALTADLSILAANASSLVEGGAVDLTASFGSVGSLGQGGTADSPAGDALPIVVDVGTASVDNLKVTSEDDVFVRQSTGDLRVDKIDSITGNIRVEVKGGNLVDANNISVPDTQNLAELEGRWNSMLATQSTAQISVNDTINAYENQIDQEYQTYWIFRDEQPNSSVFDPTFQVTLPPGQLAAWTTYYTNQGTSQGLSGSALSTFVNNALTTLGNADTQEYRTFNAIFGKLGNSFNPNYMYFANQTPLAGSVTLNFGPADIDPTGTLIDLPGNGYVTGQALVYHANGGSAGGLTDGSTYYAIVDPADSNEISLAASYQDATNANPIQLSNVTGTGNSLSDIFASPNEVFGPGNIDSTGFVISLPGNAYTNGQAVVYHANGGSVGGLTDGDTYYVIVDPSYDPTQISLASSYANATATYPVLIQLSPVTGADNVLSEIFQTFGASQVDPTGLSIDLPQNVFTTGQAVIYHANGGSAGGLTDGDTYYVIVDPNNTGSSALIGLASSFANATASPPVPIQLTSVTGTGNYLSEVDVESERAAWSQSQLQNSMSLSILEPVLFPSTVQTIPDPNVEGKNVAIVVSGSIGTVSGQDTIPLPLTGALPEQEALDLAAAQPADVTFYNAGPNNTLVAVAPTDPSFNPVELTINLQKGISLENTGVVDATAGQNIDLDSGQDVANQGAPLPITLDLVTASGGSSSGHPDGVVRILGLAGIVNGQPAGGVNIIGGNLFLEGGNTGGIGTSLLPIVIDLAPTALLEEANAELSVSISEVNGDLNLVTAFSATGDVDLTAAGSILNGNTVNDVNVDAASAILFASDNIGTASSPITTAVGNLQAQSTTGSIWLVNSGALTVGGVLANTTLPGVQAGGTVNIIAMSPITITQSINSVGDITVTSTHDATRGDMVLATGASIDSTTGSVFLQAGDDFTEDAGTSIQAAVSITITGEYGNLTGPGSQITLGGLISAPSVVIDANGASANVTLNSPTGLSTTPGEPGELLTVNGGTGDTTFSAQIDGNFAADMTLLNVATITAFTIAGDLSGQVEDSSTINTMSIGGSLTSTGTITAGNINDLTIDQILAGQVKVSGYLNFLTVGIAVTGTYSAGQLGKVVIDGVVINPRPLTLTSIASVASPRNTPVSSVDVTFNEPVNLGTFTDSALTLSDNGGPNLITGAVTVTSVSGSTYQINGLSGLTASNGNDTLTVSATGIQDPSGNAGTNTLSTSWLMDTTPPTSHVNALAKRGTSLTFAVSVTGSDQGNPPSGVASYDIYSSTNGGPWALWTNVPPVNPTAMFTGQSNTTYAFYSIAHDFAGNTESKKPLIEASTYLPDLTPPVTSVDGTTGPNPSSVNSSSGTFTLNLTGSDPGGGLVTYFEVFASVDGGAYQEVGPYTIPAGAADSKGNDHSTIIDQGLTDGQSHTYSFYSIGYDSAGNVQAAPTSPNVTFPNEVFAVPGQLQVVGFTVEHGGPGRSFVRYLDLAFNESDSQSGGKLTSIVSSISTSSPDIQIYKYDLNGDASSKTAVSLSSPTMLDVLDHAIEIDFGASGIGGNPNTTAADGYYEVDILQPNGQTAMHHFYRLLGDVNGDGIVDQNDLNEIAASIGETSPLGWTPLSADVTGAGTVTAFDLTLATRSKGRKLGTGLSLG
ncbi:MAG: dockerin type I domain-containing protein [Isosphaerales bacterium]